MFSQKHVLCLFGSKIHRIGSKKEEKECKMQQLKAKTEMNFQYRQSLAFGIQKHFPNNQKLSKNLVEKYLFNKKDIKTSFFGNVRNQAKINNYLLLQDLEEKSVQLEKKHLQSKIQAYLKKKLQITNEDQIKEEFSKTLEISKKLNQNSFFKAFNNIQEQPLQVNILQQVQDNFLKDQLPIEQQYQTYKNYTEPQERFEEINAKKEEQREQSVLEIINEKLSQIKKKKKFETNSAGIELWRRRFRKFKRTVH